MKSHDPNQLNVFYDVPAVRESLADIIPPVYVRVQDRLAEATKNNQTLIRLQKGYGGSPWIIKQLTTEGAGGWRHVGKYASPTIAQEEYNNMLNSGLYVEG